MVKARQHWYPAIYGGRKGLQVQCNAVATGNVILISNTCSEDRIKNGVKKLEKHREGATQGRLDTFFKALPSPTAAAKRKVLTHYTDILGHHYMHTIWGGHYTELWTTLWVVLLWHVLYFASASYATHVSGLPCVQGSTWNIFVKTVYIILQVCCYGNSRFFIPWSGCWPLGNITIIHVNSTRQVYMWHTWFI